MKIIIVTLAESKCLMILNNGMINFSKNFCPKFSEEPRKYIYEKKNTDLGHFLTIITFVWNNATSLFLYVSDFVSDRYIFTYTVWFLRIAKLSQMVLILFKLLRWFKIIFKAILFNQRQLVLGNCVTVLLYHAIFH